MNGNDPECGSERVDDEFGEGCEKWNSMEVFMIGDECDL